MRARFVDADGVSFFREVYEPRNVHSLLTSQFDEELNDFRSSEPVVRTVQIDHYRREYWYIPIGPLACPTYYGVDRFGEPRVWDVVYRIEGST